ncbi:MAG: MBL fold metallo-hydrolase, partial [Oscillospiraceae bacterium]|nr:MBL fold metallo-hydrolase [Oscillospiraceae bacterium]
GSRPSSTLGWIIVVFAVLVFLYDYFAPQLQDAADELTDVPTAEQPVEEQAQEPAEEQAEESAEEPTEPQTETQDEQPAAETGEPKSLTVHFLDVGQGDSALLISGGETMLIDGGPRSAGDGLVEDLAELGITHLDYMVATHSHEDHIGGLPDVLNAVTVENCLMPDDVADSKIYETFLTGLEAGNVAVTVPEAGEEFTFGDCTFTVLGPKTVSDEHNENSLVMKVSCGDTDYLFTGDMEGKEEYDMVTLGDQLQSEILKVPHHGSEYACYENFLREVKPRIAIISCGEGNSYGHPNEALLERLAEWDLDLYRTDLNGRITCVTTVTDGGTDTVVTCQRKG